MPTWQFFHITTKVGRSSLTFLLPTTGHPLPEPADYSVPTIDHIQGWLTGWLCSMLFHVLPRFYGLVIAKKWAQKLAPSQSLLAAAALLPPTTTQWFQMSKIRQNIISPQVFSRVFPWKYLEIHVTSVSGCLRFTFKTCLIVVGRREYDPLIS